MSSIVCTCLNKVHAKMKVQKCMLIVESQADEDVVADQDACQDKDVLTAIVV